MGLVSFEQTFWIVYESYLKKNSNIFDFWIHREKYNLEYGGYFSHFHMGQ